jgi:hypothetical protein
LGWAQTRNFRSFSLGCEAKTRSISRETATAMFFFNDINILLSPFHGLMFIFK